MTSYSFTIPGRLYGMNELINANRTNRYAGALLKKKAQAHVGYAVIAGNVPNFVCPVKVTVRWVEPNNKRDLDNICGGVKPILDSLVELHRLPDDSRRWIKGISHEFPEVDKVNPRIEVQITEMEEPDGKDYRVIKCKIT